MAATLTGSAPARPRKLLASRRTRVGILYALPVVVYLLVLFVYPIFSTLLLSLKNADGSFTLHWYADALTGVNLSVLFTTLRISAETALLSLVFGFILANAISRLKPAVGRTGHAGRRRPALHQRPGTHLRLDHHARRQGPGERDPDRPVACPGRRSSCSTTSSVWSSAPPP